MNHLPLFKGSLSQAEKVLRGLFERIYIEKFTCAIDCLSVLEGELSQKRAAEFIWDGFYLKKSNTVQQILSF